MSGRTLACQWVKRGGIIAYPTEAVFGLGCDPLNQTALMRLLEIKGRDKRQGFIIVAGNTTQLHHYIKPLSDELAARVAQDWPGPVTWVLPAADDLPDLLTGFRETIAVRVSAHPTIVALCEKLQHPLVSTSANLSGEKELRTTDAVTAVFKSLIDYIVDEPVGVQKQPSAIYDAATLTRVR